MIHAPNIAPNVMRNRKKTGKNEAMVASQLEAKVVATDAVNPLARDFCASTSF